MTALTLGLLLPLQSFKLEKFVTDRSWYGTARFHQEGRWTKLYSAMKHLFLGVGILVISGLILAADNSSPFAFAIMAVGYIWVLVGLVYYRIKAFEYLTQNKVLGDDIRFETAPRVGHVMKVVIFAGLAIALVAAVLFGALALVISMILPGLAAGGSAGIGVIIVAALYIIALITINGLSLVWITQSILGHLVRVTRTPDAAALDAIEQRDADRGADAEGFADALDVGGAI